MTRQAFIPCENRIINLHVHNKDEHISKDIVSNNNFYEHYALNYTRDKVAMHNRLVLDIGANIGNHSVYFSEVCGAKVLAFEPNDKNYAVLCRNSAGRAIIPLRILVGNGGEYACKEIHPENMGMCKYAPAGAGERAHAIDDLNLDDVALIKIDVEGMEREVLDGALKTIERCSPAIMCEADGNTDEMACFLQTLGYNITGLKAQSGTILAIRC